MTAHVSMLWSDCYVVTIKPLQYRQFWYYSFTDHCYNSIVSAEKSLSRKWRPSSCTELIAVRTLCFAFVDLKGEEVSIKIVNGTAITLPVQNRKISTSNYNFDVSSRFIRLSGNCGISWSCFTVRVSLVS